MDTNDLEELKNELSNTVELIKMYEVKVRNGTITKEENLVYAALTNKGERLDADIKALKSPQSK